jgi:hypothetical protein
MLVFSRLFSPEKKTRIPIKIAITEINIIANSFHLLNQVNLPSPELVTHLIRKKIPFNGFISYYDIDLNVKLFPGELR